MNPAMQRDLSHALDQISEIRRQMVRGQVFRGYRAQTTALTGILAIAAAAVQPMILPKPWLNLPGYLFLWGGLAIVCAVLFAGALIYRCRRLASPLQNERTLEAVERFVPALAAGAILTLVFFRFITDQMWMMPGLWAICFSLGLFASRTLLPRFITVVAGYYLIAGCLSLVLSRHPHEFSPWAMGLTFGVGQLLCAAVLYWNLERRNAPRQA
jgi:tellurite resistance protein TehA-like permease